MRKTKKIQKTVKSFRKRARGGRSDLKSAATVKKIERRYQVVKLRRDGYSMQEIADTIGTSIFTVSEDLRILLKEAVEKTSETVEESRQLQLLRLDQLLKTYTSYATDTHMEIRISSLTQKEIIVEVPPNPKYAELILKVEERRSKLLALDMPETKRIEATGIREYIGVDLEKI